MTFFRRLAQCAVALLVPSTGLSAQTRADVPDSAAFVAVVRTIVADTEFFMHSRLSIDPRPLRVTVEPDSRTVLLAPMSPTALLARERALQTLGILTGDARQPASCSGIMIPHSPTTYHKGCPSHRREVVSIDVPHVATASELPGGTATNGPQWVTHVVHASIGPEGVSYLVWSYVLVRNDVGWMATKGKLIGFVE